MWISEIMLQQTRVEAVKPYYERFLSELPDVSALASVEEDRLLKLWEGLGSDRIICLSHSETRSRRKCSARSIEAYGR